MTDATPATVYPRSLVVIHWLTALLIVGVFASIEFRVLFERGTPMREGMKTLHFMLGLAVFALVFLRIALRRQSSTPGISPLPPAWQRAAASAVHVSLYGFMIAMPLLGWLTLSAAGKPIPFFGLSLPALLPENKDLAKVLKEVHETAGNILYFIIGLHAFAALAHHYVFRDNTLTRMAPALIPPRR